MKTIIRNGYVIDPLTQTEGIRDILLEDGWIKKVEPSIQGEYEECIDASNKMVWPGLIDLHVHLRDPGFTYKETLTTGGMAAAKGGVTTLCAMPNTKPVVDNAALAAEVMKRGEKESPVRIIQLGSVTKGQEGKELSAIKEMAKEGIHGISEDGKSVMNASLYRKAMRLAKENNLVVFAHCEDQTMVEGGVMNADEEAVRLGLPGITNGVEDVIVARDILLAKETGVRLHLCHCSTKDSVQMIAMAKKAGVSVTAEVCPHHFILTSSNIKEDDGNFKMNPPLRREEDVKALLQGLKEGVIDAIATDHAPHSQEEKDCSFTKAKFGIVGLETLASLSYTYLVKTGWMTPLELLDRMSLRPAQILGREDIGGIVPGRRGDLVIFDPSAEYCICKDEFLSKGKNTPFEGWKVTGQVCQTIVQGKTVYQYK